MNKVPLRKNTLNISLSDVEESDYIETKIYLRDY